MRRIAGESAGNRQVVEEELADGAAKVEVVQFPGLFICGERVRAGDRVLIEFESLIEAWYSDAPICSATASARR